MDKNTVLSSIVETTSTDRGFMVTSFSMSGEPYAAAIVDAVNVAYPRPDDLAGLLASLDGKQVTLLRGGESMFGAASISLAEGKLFNGGTALLPKGKRKNGHRLNAAAVLDVIEGYGNGEILRARVAEVRAALPELAPLTVERFEALPSWEAAVDDTGPSVTLAVFGTWRMPDGPAPGSVYLVNAYDPDNEIVEGVLLISPEYGVSEHGSCYVKDLLRMGGEIVGFVPISYATAIDLTDRDLDWFRDAKFSWAGGTRTPVQ